MDHGEKATSVMNSYVDTRHPLIRITKKKIVKGDDKTLENDEDYLSDFRTDHCRVYLLCNCQSCHEETQMKLFAGVEPTGFNYLGLSPPRTNNSNDDPFIRDDLPSNTTGWKEVVYRPDHPIPDAKQPRIYLTDPKVAAVAFGRITRR
mmetsp:Transcript_36857/g.89303  ORF Transcript_36857/g.89303 Transcript_36857/m.89303 type:complete len:148 (-) Transcript_36857:6930-7373(-)